MKKILLGTFLFVGICSFIRPTFKEDLKALAAENKVLAKKTDSLYNSIGAVNTRITKVNKMVGQENQTIANLIPVFEKECNFLVGILDKALALQKSLDEQIAIVRQTDKDINKDMSLTDTDRTRLLNELDRIGKENTASYEKIKEVIKIFKDHKGRVCKDLEKMKKKAQND